MVANANQGRLEKKWFRNLIDKNVLIIFGGEIKFDSLTKKRRVLNDLWTFNLVIKYCLFFF